MYQEARLARQWMKGTRNNEHTRQVFGGFTSGSFDSAEDERTTRLDLDSAEDERTRNSEHTRQVFGDFTSGSFDSTEDERTRNNDYTRQVFGGFTSGSFDPAGDEKTRNDGCACLVLDLYKSVVARLA